MEHEIKLQSQFFDAVLCGDKTFEIRNNDRGYQKGDTLRLVEICEQGLCNYFLPTGRSIGADISFVLSGWGLQDGYVALGLKNIKELQNEKNKD